MYKNELWDGTRAGPLPSILATRVRLSSGGPMSYPNKSNDLPG
jgi:hypothetical protein